MVSPQKIKYNNLELDAEMNPMDIILDVAFDSDNGATSSFLNRSAVSSESHDGRYKNTYKYKYDELFTPRFTIMKKDFADFSQSEVRRVLKYLTQTDKPALLEVSYDRDGETPVEERNFCAIGGWTEIETYKLANNRTVAILATFEAITPYAMSDLESHSISASDNYTKTITVKTDDNQPVFPRITIQEKGIVVSASKALDVYSDMIPNTVYKYGTTFYWKSDTPSLCTGTKAPDYGWESVTVSTAYNEEDVLESGKVYYYSIDKKYRWIDPYTFKSSTTNPNLSTTGVRIKNTNPDVDNKNNVMVIKNNTETEIIVLDGANKIASSNSVKRILNDDFNWKWLELYDGENQITVEGNCTVTIEYREVRKIGEW